ncbi:MAG: MarR family transcriptional regulator [Bacteroidia bacterium]|nr:MarR family transcriptional regulator [Bacteroidia bacterium]
MSPSIKEELQQKSFRNPHQQVQVNILFTSGWIESRHLQIFKKFGISHQQYNVLRILKGSHPNSLNLGQIKSRMLDRMSDTSRIVERLRTSGYLKRLTSPDDRRVAKIMITEKGLQLLAKMANEEKVLDGISHGLTDDEAKQLSELLDKLRQAVAEN